MMIWFRDWVSFRLYVIFMFFIGRTLLKNLVEINFTQKWLVHGYKETASVTLNFDCFFFLFFLFFKTGSNFVT